MAYREESPCNVGNSQPFQYNTETSLKKNFFSPPRTSPTHRYINIIASFFMKAELIPEKNISWIRSVKVIRLDKLVTLYEFSAGENYYLRCAGWHWLYMEKTIWIYAFLLLLPNLLGVFSVKTDFIFFKAAFIHTVF